MKATRLAWAALALSTAAAQAPAHAGRFTLSSPEIRPGHELPSAQVNDANGCKGGNVSPELRWQGAPAGTRSFAVTFYDPDAPTGSGWWHWVVFNLPAGEAGLAAGAGASSGTKLPPGAVQSRTDFGVPGFGGACPPRGAKPHRYVFTVHALRVAALDAGPDATPAQVGYLLHLNELARARLETRFARP